MTDYAKLVSRILYSENSDYSYPNSDTGMLEYTFAPSKCSHYARIPVTTSGYTIDLSNFTTVQAIYIKNHDATNYVDASWRYEKSTKTWAVDQLTFADSGTADTITDAGSTFVSALAMVEGDYVVITGCTEQTGNNGTWFVAGVAADVLTMGPGVGLTSTTGTEGGAVTFVVLRANAQRVPASGILTFCGSVNIAADLALAANTATCECEVVILGT